MKKIWVKSRDGKSKHFTDTSTKDKDGNPVSLDISIEMGERGIPIEVLETVFVRGMASNGELEQVPDEDNAKKTYEKYVKEREKRQQEQTEKSLQKMAIEKQVLDAAKKAVQAVLEQKIDKLPQEGAKPKIIRNKPDA